MLLFKRCTICDITDDALVSASHPMADFYDSTQAYQEYLNHIEWFRSQNGELRCSDCHSDILDCLKDTEDEETGD